MKLIIILLIAAIALGAFFYLEKTRTDALAQVAKELGFEFRGGQFSMPDELAQAGFYLFAQGRNQIKNLMTGSDGNFTYHMFGYGYKAGRGMEGDANLPNSNDDGQIDTRLQTVLWITSPSHRLPDFDLTPTNGPLRRAARDAGLHGISFDGREDFSAKYVLAGRDEAKVREVFTPEVIDYLVERPAFTFESRGNQWLLYREGDRVEPGNIHALLNLGKDLVDRLNAVPQP